MVNRGLQVNGQEGKANGRGKERGGSVPLFIGQSVAARVRRTMGLQRSSVSGAHI